MSKMPSERTQMSQDALGWSLKLLSVTLTEEGEQSQFSLSGKTTHTTSFKDALKFITAQIKELCVLKSDANILAQRRCRRWGKLNLSLHYSSCEQKQCGSLVHLKWILLLFLWITWCLNPNVKKRDENSLDIDRYRFSPPERILKLAELITVFTFCCQCASDFCFQC